MPVKSYIATPLNGKLKELHLQFEQIEGCEVIPSQNKDVLIVLTDTDTDEQDEKVYQLLLSVPDLEQLTLVSGYSTSREQPLPTTL
jgi:nitrate reductase NapAB chaperone NapD